MSPFIFFEDFLKIPRESGNEKAIADYLVDFAKKKGLEYYRDLYNNVIIKKKSNRNSKEIIALQGHTDMVCTSINNYDFENNGIDWFIEDGFYKTKGTTLGADNGMGCAMILSVLSNDNISIPNIEAIFTTSEETNMNGAKRLDFSKINAKKLISLDGTEEGVIDVSSAGMISLEIKKKILHKNNDLQTYKIVVSGLKGGHSGIDIDKNRGNAIVILFELLNQLSDYNLISINGGTQYNVIPNYCECIIASTKKPSFNLSNFTLFEGLNVKIEKTEKCAKVIKKEDFLDLIRVMHNFPKGVITYIESYPQTSANIAAIETSYEHITIKVSIRSSSNEEIEKVLENIKQLLSKSYYLKMVDEVPPFSYKKKSKLRNLLAKKYFELYKKNVIFNHVHAGLECGIFSKNIEKLDICVISPNLYGIHTVNEMLDVESVKRVYDWLINTLKDI